ncbi:hypothetical protein HPB51_020049 [Rhipicephalus microplus]|uniref:Transposable element P transposase-like GTP-binding insertion domain-containing protein n=1 Tax=Rhipicephalus microplus TaxID=6941 RepID=A0A9J6DVZ5_RHIMP|nr:hypothetical protein HPB51_020049 [Rhipicephalus microplus]
MTFNLYVYNLTQQTAGQAPCIDTVHDLREAATPGHLVVLLAPHHAFWKQHPQQREGVTSVHDTGSPTFDSWNVRASTILAIFYKLEESGGVVYVEKAVVIRQDLATEVSSRGVLVPPCSYIEKDGNIPTLLTSQKNLTMFLRYIDALKICPGCKCELFPGILSSKAAMKRQGVWRNKKCMVLSGKLHEPKHRVDHPCVPDQQLYFLCDVPHIKCIRNHLMRHKYGMIGEHKINFDHYRRLQEVDGKQQLRVVPKLTKEHVSPDNLRKKNVSLAVELFSRSTAIGLKVYQRLEEPDLKDCHGTAQFTLMVNNLFDALNVKLPKFGITSSSKEVERFFGVTRSYGGDENHPTLISFAHIYRLLSLYTPISTCVTGSVSDEQTFVLATVADSMKRGRKDTLSSHERLHEAIRAKLAEISSTAQNETLTAPDHGYSTPAAQDCVIYYLCGYLVHSYLKHQRCSDCVRNIQSENAECPEAFLTLEREFKHGSLKLPSWELFCMFRGIEAKISDELQKNRLCSETFWSLLDALEDCDITSVGCSVHKVTTTAELLHSYIVLRLHFAARDTCKNFSSSEKVASARKKVKLM